MDLGIDGKVALVGASSQGLGHACAQALAYEGVQVVMCARRESQLQAAAAEIARQAPTAPLPVVADLTQPAHIERLLAETRRHFGPPDILVNNIGGPPPGGALDHDEAAFQAACRRLLLYPLRMLHLCLPDMRARRFGRIVNITSMSVKEPTDELVLSGVFRTGLVSLCKSLAPVLAPDNVTLNNVAPGAFATDRSRQLLQARAHSLGRPLDQVRAEQAQKLPAGRLLQPAELGAVVAFLCSTHASAVTGATLPVDGGGMHSLF